MEVEADHQKHRRKDREVPPDVVMPSEEELSALEAELSDVEPRKWLPEIATLLAVAAPILQVSGILAFYLSLGAAAVHGDARGVLVGVSVFAAGGLSSLVGGLLASLSMYKAGKAKVTFIVACIEFAFFLAVLVWYFTVIV